MNAACSMDSEGPHMSSRSKMTVTTRLALGFGSVTLLGLLIAAVSLFVLRDVSAKLDSLAKDRMVKVEKLSLIHI